MAEFKSRYGTRVDIEASKLSGVAIDFGGAVTTGVVMEPTDAPALAQAILDAAGVDAVVLTDLPKVEATSRGRLALSDHEGYVYRAGDQAGRWRLARQSAALARYEEQNPPVDPKVEELKADIRSAVLAPDDSTVDLITKQLLARGWTKQP